MRTATILLGSALALFILAALIPAIAGRGVFDWKYLWAHPASVPEGTQPGPSWGYVAASALGLGAFVLLYRWSGRRRP